MPFNVVGDVVALLVGDWTYDSQVAGSSPGRAPLRNGLRQLLTLDQTKQLLSVCVDCVFIML